MLWDKLAISGKEVTEAERREMDKLANSVVLTSQGISFYMQARILRIKRMEKFDSLNINA